MSQLTRYETLFLAGTEITEDDMSMIEKHIDTQVSEKKGKLGSFDKWGKYMLAYPVNKNTHGVFVLARYEIPDTQASTFMKDLELFFKIKCSDIILRHVNIKLDQDAPAAYAKPEPIDISRASSLEFLKDNKIENLLSSVNPKDKGGDGEEDNNHEEMD